MADSPIAALSMLRRLGPGRFTRFAVDRLIGFWRTWRWISRLPPDASDREVIDVLTHRLLGQGQPVFAMQRPEEILALLERVRLLEPRTVLEIGTAAGGTLMLLARAARPDATIMSLDLPGGGFGGGYASWRRGLYRKFAGPSQTLILIRGNSHQPALVRRIEDILDGRPLDLLFIDGDHSYEGVRQDYLDYGRLVRPEGLIVFHDICADPAQPTLEVPRFWRELRENHRSEEFTTDPRQEGYGIGLIRLERADVRGASSGKTGSPAICRQSQL